MTKHELLTYIHDRGKVSKKMISEFFSVHVVRANAAINTLVTQGLARAVSRLKGRKTIIYSLTEKGVNRMRYFDNGNCPNTECSCHR